MRNTDVFDCYLNNELNETEKVVFETRLKNDHLFCDAFEHHKKLINTLQEYTNQTNLRATLKAIHEKEFGGHAQVISINAPIGFFKRYGKTMAVAASTAAIVMFCSIALFNQQKQQQEELTTLGKKVLALEYTNDAIVEEIVKTNTKLNYVPANYEGSAFALNNNGYIVTSYHTIKDADSILIENANTKRTLTTVVYQNPKLDIAVLHVNEILVAKDWQVPFCISDRTLDIGEKIYTLGYPRKDIVYGEGSISSLSGFNNDSKMYQVSIPVNPGNSGGPVLDEQGNLIGIVRGKNKQAEATGFALKTHELIEAVANCAKELQKEDLVISAKKSNLKGVKRTEQIKRITPYVFNVLVYKN